MNEFSPQLLKAALSPSDAEAALCWRAWRDAVDIEHISWPELQFISILSSRRLNEWLSGDAASGVFRGIVRRTWFQAQVRLKLAQETLAALADAGCDSVTCIGAAGNYLRTLNPGSIRPLSELRLLIRRQNLAAADAALLKQGWERRGQTPQHADLDWWNHLPYSMNETQMFLHWRALPVGGSAGAACEEEFLSRSRLVQSAGASFRILASEHALLEAMADKPGFGGVDVIPWQADAAAISQGQIDWRLWSELAVRFSPAALDRISELRTLGLAIPQLPRVSDLHADNAGIAGRFADFKRRAGRWARRALALAGVK